MSTKATSIQISHEQIYISFRAAWLTTFEALVSDVAGRRTEVNGFLSQIPILAGTAPQVQLECLQNTWTRLREPTMTPDLLDRCVCFAATSELARLAEIEHRPRLQKAIEGPAPLSDVDLLWLAPKLRASLVTMPVRDDVFSHSAFHRTISADLDRLSSPDAGLQSQILSVLGAWKVSAAILRSGQGLLSESEQEMLAAILSDNPRMVNL